MSPSMWFRTVGLCALLIAAIAVASVLAGDAKPKSYALLVGVNAYESDKLSKLKYAENDVEKLAEILRDPKRGGFDEVRVLSNSAGKKDKADAPTAKTVREAIAALVKKKKSGDVVLIAFSGHGLQLEVSDPDEAKTKNKPRSYSYFCPVDADFTDSVSYSTGKCDSLIHVKEVFAALDNCGASSRLVLMDACRNEFKAENASRSLDVDNLRVPKGVGVLFACDAGQKAFETAEYGHGVFFHFVLEALRGKAKKDAKEVTWDELVTYVKREVSETVPTLIGSGAKQEPHFIGSLKGRSPVLARVDAAGKGPLGEGDKNNIGMKFAKIPAGEFTMGASKDDDKEAGNDENPHKVVIDKAFYLGRCEVTQGEWVALMKYNPSYFCRDGKKGGKGKYLVEPAGGEKKVKDVKDAELTRYPVENVSYVEAQQFIDKLNEKEKKTLGAWKYSLPSEAQWEYACRGGATSYKKYHFGDSISKTDANFNAHLGRTEETGKYPANKFGLHDMHGNVWEWCLDWHDDDYKGADKDFKGSFRVFRGGCWNLSAVGCRAAYRGYSGTPSARRNELGFRVALVPAR